MNFVSFREGEIDTEQVTKESSLKEGKTAETKTPTKTNKVPAVQENKIKEP